MSDSMSTSLDFPALLVCLRTLELIQSKKNCLNRFRQKEGSKTCVLPESITTIYTLSGMTLTLLNANRSTFPMYTKLRNH